MIEKLEQELKAAMVMPLEMIAKYLDEECGRDPALVLRIEDEKKTLEKCYRYVEKKAQEVAKNKHSVYIDDPTVYSWAKEYYMNEEKEPAKESKKENMEGKEPSEEKPKKKSKKKKTEEAIKEELPEENTEEDAKTEETIPGEVSGQTSMMDDIPEAVPAEEKTENEEKETDKKPLTFEECTEETTETQEKETELAKPGEPELKVDVLVVPGGASWFD